MTATLSVDGEAFPFSEGETVLDVLRRIGAETPALCYEPRLPPQGACRLCLVHVAGRPGLIAACVTPAEPGMRVATHSPDLDEYKRTILEMVLAETPPAETCPRCSLLGPCDLHAAAERYGAKEGQFPALSPGAKAKDPNPFIQRDYRWCILCYRCVKVCREWEMASAITVFGRGRVASIASPPNNLLLESPCTFCGQCIHTCPTGALMNRKLVGRLEPVVRPAGERGNHETA